MMTKSQGEALIALLGQLRKDWDLPGIRAAVIRAAELGSPSDVATAACRIAGSQEARTPGLIPQPGNHWQGTAVGARLMPVMCLTHADQPLGRCTVCAARAMDLDYEPLVAAVRASLTTARAKTRAERDDLATHLGDQP